MTKIVINGIEIEIPSKEEEVERVERVESEDVREDVESEFEDASREAYNKAGKSGWFNQPKRTERSSFYFHKKIKN